jgi:hypothetical protein
MKRNIKMKPVLIFVICALTLCFCISAESVPAPKPETAARSAVSDTSPGAIKSGNKSAIQTNGKTLSLKTAAKPYDKIGQNGILVTERDGHLTALMPCWGTLEMCAKYAKSLNSFAKKIPDINVYSMVIPTAVEFYLPQNHKGMSGSQKARIDKVSETLDGVTAADAYSALEQHKNEPIYSRTDHHWFPLGAYYAANVFLEKKGIEPLPLEQYKAVTKNGYVGSMYNYSKDINLKNDPENFTMYIPPFQTPATYYNTNFASPRKGKLFTSPDAGAYYCSFLGTDNIIAEVAPIHKTPTGKTLVIFKESYGNALVPFLAQAYDKIYVCDIRYFGLDAVKFCKNVKADDVLFAVCTFTAAGSNGNYAAKLAGIK